MKEDGGVRVNRTSRTPCFLCGAPDARVGLRGTFDVTGRAEPPPTVPPRILAFMHEAAAEGRAGEDGGKTPLGADSDNTDGFVSTNGSKKENRLTKFAGYTFEDIKRTKPSADQKAIVDKIMAFTVQPVGAVRKVVDEGGPEREGFLRMLRGTAELFDALVEASDGCITAAQVAFRSAHMGTVRAQTTNPERFKATVEGLVDADLFDYGLEIQTEGVRVHTTADETRIRRDRPQARSPHPDQELEVMVEAFNDFLSGGLVLMSMSPETERAGRFADVVTSPMFSVPKNEMDGTPSNRRRPVHH